MTDQTGTKAHAGHVGIEVPSPDDVGRWMEWVRSDGISVEVEEDTRCCYSRQTTFWASDPDGRRWEVFYVAERDASGIPDPASSSHRMTGTCCAS